MKPAQLVEFLKFAIEHKRPVLIKGKAGVGKTDIVKQAVSFLDARFRAMKTLKMKNDEVGVDLLIFHPVVSDPTDAKGMPCILDGKDGSKEAVFLPFAELKKLMEAKKLTVVFLDDLGQAPPAVQASFMQMILAREINGKKISDNIVFISATNRKEDKAGVTGILEPVKSRFHSIVQLDVDANDWVLWALTHNMPMELIAFIRLRPSILDSAVATNDIVNSPCPRTVANAGDWMNDGLTQELEYEVFKGSCGEAFAVQFTSFLKLYRELPDINNIPKNPDNVEVPVKGDLQYAVCGAVVNLSNKVNLPNIIKYMKRMPREFQQFVMKDIGVVKPELMQERSFMQWEAEAMQRQMS